MMTSSHTAGDACCPACLTKLDGATNPNGNGHTPRPGDVSVCAYCTSALVFNDDLTLRAMRAAEYAELPTELRYSLDILRAAAIALNRKLGRS